MKRFDFAQCKQSGFTPILIVILVAVLGIGGYFVYTNYSNNQTKINPTPDPVTCTEDAKLCPDGSYVARVLPKCGFAPCPTPTKDMNNPCNYDSKYGSIVRVEDCGDFKVLSRGCCDIPDTILDKNGNRIMECGGIAGYSSECKERFSPQTNCQITECK